MDALTEEELRTACRARGLRAPFGEGAQKFMKRQLTEWLDLSLNRCLPLVTASLSSICISLQKEHFQQHLVPLSDLFVYEHDMHRDSLRPDQAP